MLRNQSLDAKNTVFLHHKRGVSKHYVGALMALRWDYVELTDSLTPNRHFSDFAAKPCACLNSLGRALVINFGGENSRTIVQNVLVFSTIQNYRMSRLAAGLEFLGGTGMLRHYYRDAA